MNGFRSAIRLCLSWLCVAALAAIAGCRGQATQELQIVTLNGAGATFPYPLYARWIAEYRRIQPRVLINYQSIGSSAGVRQITASTVDFGASDDPLTAQELQRFPTPVLQIPTAIGAVVLTYNWPGEPQRLNLEPNVVAGIYLGRITRWNDPALRAANPEAALPDLEIRPIYRGDGGGTTAIFTRWLASVEPAWKERVGAGKQVHWPAGFGRKRSEGVVSGVRETVGSLGYVELAYASAQNLPVAWVRNRGGKFVGPTVASMHAAVQGAREHLASVESVVQVSSPEAYPLTAFTFAIVYRTHASAEKGRELTAFLRWALVDGQSMASPQGYAPLPAAMVQQALSQLN